MLEVELPFNLVQMTCNTIAECSDYLGKHLLSQMAVIRSDLMQKKEFTKGKQHHV